jgi:hypothetical protein
MGYCFSSLSKSATENLLNVSEIGLIISGFVLLFGAVGEYLEEHGKLPRWMKWPKIVFIIMVVASLVGEFLCDAGVFIFSSHLQTINEGEFAALNIRASEANERAQTLEALIRPRYLTDAQLDGIAKAVRTYGGPTVPLLIGSHWNDPESTRLARQIKAALNRGGIGSGPDQPVDLIRRFPQIPVGQWNGGVIEGIEIHEGVEVWGKNREAIAEALLSIGKVDATTPPLSECPFRLRKDGMVAILVGLKPLPKVKPRAGN